MKKHYDILFTSESAIGNTIEMLYALEYCLFNKIKAAIYLQNFNDTFIDYLRWCYGDVVILLSLDDVSTVNFVHTFLVGEKIDLCYQNYFYINPDWSSTRYQTETEQYLSIVHALYPSDYRADTLKMLKADMTERVRMLDVENKYVFYSGCASFTPVKRWPYFRDLAELIGNDRVIFVGGLDDLNYEFSYTYKPMVGRLIPYRLTNRKSFWQLCKKLNLIQPYAHDRGIEHQENSFFNVYQWGELVAIFMNARGFVGNDGGLMHLAAAVGAKGVAVFGPSSVEKNKAYNPSMKVLKTDYDCQPCQFSVTNVYMAKGFIACPYDIKCLKDITPEIVADSLIDGQMDESKCIVSY